MRQIFIHLLFLLLINENNYGQLISFLSIDYDTDVMQKMEAKPALFQNVMFSVDNDSLIGRKYRLNTLPFEYLALLIQDLQKGKNFQNDYWENKIHNLRIDSLCKCEANKEQKKQCAEFSKSLIEFQLKVQMFQAFEKENLTVYCKLFSKYLDVETQYFQYIYQLFPERVGFCGELVTDYLYWYKTKEDIVMTFIQYDYLMSQSRYRDALIVIEKIINNNIIYLQESELLQKLAAHRIANFIVENDIHKDVKRELKTKLKYFKQNTKAQKGMFFQYRTSVYNIPITLETLSDEQELTTIQQDRFDKSLPIKTKREIIKEFKKNEIYKVMTKKRFLRKYSKD